MTVSFKASAVPTATRGASLSIYAEPVKELIAKRDSALETTVPVADADVLLRTLRHDAVMLGDKATIRARKVADKDGKNVHLTIWAVDKIRQNRQPRA